MEIINTKRFLKELLLLIIFLISFSSYSQNEEKDGWKEDLEYLRETLPKVHNNAFHKISQENFNKMIDNLKLSVHELNEDQFYAGIAKIIASIGDGHTVCRWWSHPIGRGMLPLHIEEFNDGIYITHTAPEYNDLLRGKLNKIEDLPINEFIEKFIEYAPGDNEYDRRRRLWWMIVNPSLVYGAGLSDSNNALTIEVLKENKLVKKTVKELPQGVFQDAFALNPSSIKMETVINYENTPLLYLQNLNKNFWTKFLDDEKILYVRMLRVLSDQNQKMTINDLADSIAYYDDHHQLEKIIIDLRFNGGGNNQLVRKFTHEIIKSSVNEYGKLFTLINDGTFSAASYLVSDLENHTNTIFVGEPTAASPNHYGDNRMITLPNTGWMIRASSLYWQNVNPWDKRPYTAPNYFIEPTFNDYLTGKDPAIDFVLNFEGERSFQEQLKLLAINGDYDEAKNFYYKYTNNSMHKFQNTNSLTNSLGYQLMSKGMMDAAEIVFKLNVEMNSDQANPYDSYGEILFNLKKYEESKKMYKKALELDETGRLHANANAKISKINEMNEK